MNLIEGKEYPHHPVMLEVPIKAYPLRKDELVEVNGLRVPAKYDCNNFNGGKGWGHHAYFWMIASRWYSCYLHEASINSGMTIEIPKLPIVDEEYAEQTALYQAVLRADPLKPFVMVELGARWGTWGARGIQFHKAIHGEDADYNLYVVEGEKINCDGLENVMKLNNIKYHLYCKYADGNHFRQWARTVDHIDLIDYDIQGAEVSMIESVIDVLNCKAYRLVIGTHGDEDKPLHGHIKKFMLDQGWIIISDMHRQTDDNCMVTHLRGGYGNGPGRFDWKQVMKKGCYYQSPQGKIVQGDGELIVDNPRYVDREKAFSMEDTELKINDLMKNTPTDPWPQSWRKAENSVITEFLWYGGKAHGCTTKDNQCFWNSVEEAKQQCSEWDDCGGLYCTSRHNQGKYVCYAKRLGSLAVEKGSTSYIREEVCNPPR